MSSKLKIINFLAVTSSVLLFSGCATVYNPATQRNEFLLINTKQEVSLGTQMDAQLQHELKVIRDPLIQSRLDRIGEKVASASDRQDLVYKFRVIKDKELNAFAVPGGYIYVNDGLIERANDDELACVLAHEIGHIAAKHSVKKLQSALGYQVIMSIVMGVSSQASMAEAMDIVYNLGTLGYGRQDELFADKLAVKYARKSGFSPYGMITFFQTMQKEAEKKGNNSRLVFLSSHPPLEERIKEVEKEIAVTQ